MIDLHYRQKNRPLQLDAAHFTTAEINVLDCSTGDTYWFKANAPDVDQFVKVGTWRAAVNLAIEYQLHRINFFSHDPIGKGLPAAHRQSAKARKALNQLRSLAELPDNEVSYSESFEQYVVDESLAEKLGDEDGPQSA